MVNADYGNEWYAANDIDIEQHTIMKELLINAIMADIS